MTVGPMTEDVLKAGGGFIHATVLKMNDDEGRGLAEAIATFAYEVLRVPKPASNI